MVKVNYVTYKRIFLNTYIPFNHKILKIQNDPTGVLILKHSREVIKCGQR